MRQQDRHNPNNQGIDDVRLRGQAFEVAYGDKRIVARWKQRTDDDDVFDQFRVTVGVEDAGTPVRFYVNSFMDNVTEQRVFELVGSQRQQVFCAGQGCEVKVVSLVNNEEAIGPMPGGNPIKGWVEINDRSQLPTVYETTRPGVGTGAEVTLNPVPYANSVLPYWNQADAAPTFRWYNEAGNLIMALTAPAQGTAFPMNRHGRMTIEKPAGDFYTLVWRCYG